MKEMFWIKEIGKERRISRGDKKKGTRKNEIKYDNRMTKGKKWDGKKE